MITVVVTENQLFIDNRPVPEGVAFLHALAAGTEVTLLLNPLEVAYHLCPHRKAVPYMKSAEFTPDHWVGEVALPHNQTLIAGILPSPFMHQVVQGIAQRPLALKGLFLWPDWVMRSYAPLPQGWTLIWHERHLLMCQEGILRASRPCYQPLSQELPLIVRYLKRWGYQEGMSLTLITPLEGADDLAGLPSFLHWEKRASHPPLSRGLAFFPPSLARQHRFYAWKRRIRTVTYGVAALALMGSGYFGWQIRTTTAEITTLKQRLGKLPATHPYDEGKMNRFAAYQRLAAHRPTPLPLVRHLASLFQGEAVATHVHWQDHPFRLTLQVEGKSSLTFESVILRLRSHFPRYRLTWEKDKEERLKGVLSFSQEEPECHTPSSSKQN